MDDSRELDLVRLANAPNMVLLDVGGPIFKTTKSTLLREEGSYFHALLGSGRWQPDSLDNAYFLDLDPDIFRLILNFLRTGKLSIDGLTKGDRDVLKAMAAYLNLNVWDNWNRWDPSSVLPGFVLLYNTNQTLRRVEKEDDIDVVAFATNPLGSVRIRIDSSRNTCFGAGPTTGPHAWELRYSTDWIGYSKRPTVVTICRRPTHVDIAVNDKPSFSIQIEDASEELFPAVRICEDDVLTILSS